MRGKFSVLSSLTNIFVYHAIYISSKLIVVAGPTVLSTFASFSFEFGAVNMCVCGGREPSIVSN
jgi:hypothetical protein